MLSQVVEQRSSPYGCQALHRVANCRESGSRDRGQGTRSWTTSPVLVLYDGVPLHQLEMAYRVTELGMNLIEPLVIASTRVVEVALLDNR